ncbi:MAG: DUF6273 domain-containing protein [Propionibacteriaceae bacterium]|jgi:hypothetical protein|nr:DUF6273 domain-containing protein [Propionibacteriaceae bacterium]
MNDLYKELHWDAGRQETYEWLCAVAARYFDTGKYDFAEDALGDALEAVPAEGADLEWCKLAARTCLALGKYDSALTYLNQAIVLGPDDPRLHWFKFQAASQLGKIATDDPRGSPDELMNVLQTTISKAEYAGDDSTLALALNCLAGLIFAGPRGAQADEQACQLAVRALAIDSTLEKAGQVLATLERERHSKAAEAMINVWGEPEWVLLELDQDHRRALFIREDIVTQKPYHEQHVDVTWEDCSLRRWLNSEFFDSLPAQVKSRVVEVTIQNPDNEQYLTKGGNPTKDLVFLLSSDEVHRYFSSRYTRQAGLDDYWKPWWLRSPGIFQDQAAFVNYHGEVNDDGKVNDDGVGVRPALWLRLDA